MILLSELSRRRIRSIQKLIRVGRNEVVMVMRIDKEKGARRFPANSAAASCTSLLTRMHLFAPLTYVAIHTQFLDHRALLANDKYITGYIDLSKRRVSADDVVKCEEKFNKSKAVHSIMRHVAEKTETDLEKVNELIAWPLYDKFGHAYDAFKLSIT